MATTQKKTPIHVPANMPLLVICQSEEMKHASMVFQFHNILILQLFPMPIPDML